MERLHKLTRHLNILTGLHKNNSGEDNSTNDVPHWMGGHEVAKVLLERGVRQVYVLIGGHVSPIVVGCNQAGIRCIDVRDEVTTVFAADATSRITGIPGIGIVTAGPGLTNTITAVKNAQLAESACIIFGGATAQLLKGRGALQDIDQYSLMAPHVKWSISISQVKEIIPTIQKAFDIAQTEIPGPVFIEFPLDTIWPQKQIMNEAVPKSPPPFGWNINAFMTFLIDRVQRYQLNKIYENAFQSPPPYQRKCYYKTNFKPTEVLNVLSHLRSSKKPLIILGSQTTLRIKLIKNLIEAIKHLGTPVFLSGMARGLLGRKHKQQFYHKRSIGLKNCDFVLFAGLPTDFRVDYGRHIKSNAFFVMVNLDNKALNKNFLLRQRDEKILGDPCSFILKLAELMKKKEKNCWAPWFDFLKDIHNKREMEINKIANDGEKLKQFIHPIRACLALEQVIDENSYMIADGGDFVGTAAYTLKPRKPLRWLDPGVFGTLGVGAGFAIAAKAVNPESEVWILYGDGAFGWSLCEFDTYVRMGMSIIAVIGNDACWSQMYRDQVRLLSDSVACNLKYSYYEKVAEGFGAAGILIETENELFSGLKKAKEIARSGIPVCINILITKSSFREGSISL